MRGLGVTILALAAGCRFDLPGPRGIDGAAVDSAPPTPLRKRIAIDPARVTGNQVQFPVWIALVDDGLRAHATERGADIHFTHPDGAALPYQLQRWDKATGRLEAWVRLDLDDVAETVLELRYGDPDRASAPDPIGVFSSSFVAVWHLDDPLTAGDIADATDQRPGIAVGLAPMHQVSAQLGGGVDFDGAGARIGFENPFAGATNHTISAWVNLRTPTGYDTIVTVGNPETNQSRWFHARYLSGVSAGFYNNDWPEPGTLPNIDNDGWVLLHWVFNGTNRVGRIYRNGAEVANHTFSAGIKTQGTAGYMGYAPVGWGADCALNGILDEVRLATVIRNAGWIATEHANQSSPQTFYTVGPEEPAP